MIMVSSVQMISFGQDKTLLITQHVTKSTKSIGHAFCTSVVMYFLVSDQLVRIIEVALYCAHASASTLT